MLDTIRKTRFIGLLYRLIMPLDFVTVHPCVSLIAYYFISVIFWLQLSRLSFAPMTELVSTSSDTQKTAALIDILFGDNYDQFSLHRSSNLGMWLELIIEAKDKAHGKLLTVNAIQEVHRVDQILKNLTIINDRPIKGAGKLSLLNYYKFSDICLQQSPGKCSIDGSFILCKEFLSDVEFEDVAFSSGGYYSYPLRGLPSYGPYMFGKHITKSEFGMIDDVNALRVRYNIKGNPESRKFSIMYITKLSKKWEREASKVLNEIPLKHIAITFSTSSMLTELPIAQAKQSLPLFTVSLFFYFLFVIIFIARISESRKRYIICILAICSTIALPFTILGILTLFHYQPSMPSVICCLLVTVLGVIYFSILWSKFEYANEQRYAINIIKMSKSVYYKMCTVLLNFLAIGLCSAVIISLASSMKDVQSCAVIIVVSFLLLTVHTLFVYLPLCMLAYREFSDISQSKTNSRIHYCNCEQSSVNLLHNKCEPVNIIVANCNVRDADNVGSCDASEIFKRSEQKLALFLSGSLYSTLFTILVIVLLMMACILIIVFKMKLCNSTLSAENRNTNFKSKNKSIERCSLQTVSIVKQSDLVSPSWKTRRSNENRKKQQALSDRYNCTFPKQDLYWHFVKTDTEFIAGAPIQILYTSIDEHSNVCSTIDDSDLILNLCKSMPTTDDTFSIAFYQIFKSKVKREELISSMFKPDMVFLPAFKQTSVVTLKSHLTATQPSVKNELAFVRERTVVEDDKETSTSSSPVVRNDFEQKDSACSFVRHYRVYCSFKDMNINLLKIGSMRKLKKAIREVNAEKMSKNVYCGITNTPLPLYAGQFSAFSLIFPILDVMYDTCIVLIAAIIGISLLTCIQKLLKYIHASLLFAISSISSKLSLKSCHKCAAKKQQTNEVHCHTACFRSALFYAIIVAECILSPFMYFCLTGLKISFMNITCVIVGFIIIPVCITTFLMIELIRLVLENKAHEKAQTVGNYCLLQHNRRNEVAIRFPNELTESNSSTLKHNERIGKQCKTVRKMSAEGTNASLQVQQILFFYYAAQPVVISMLPLLVFVIMIPFTDSALFRSVQHVFFFLCTRCIFDSVFFYPFLRRMLL